jgi:hypothetical protein
MKKPSSNVEEALRTALLNVSKSPDLSEAEVDWVNQFAMRLMAEYSVLKAEADREVAVKAFDLSSNRVKNPL